MTTAIGKSSTQKPINVNPSKETEKSSRPDETVTFEEITNAVADLFGTTVKIDDPDPAGTDTTLTLPSVPDPEKPNKPLSFSLVSSTGEHVDISAILMQIMIKSKMNQDASSSELQNLFTHLNMENADAFRENLDNFVNKLEGVFKKNLSAIQTEKSSGLMTASGSVVSGIFGIISSGVKFKLTSQALTSTTNPAQRVDVYNSPEFQKATGFEHAGSIASGGLNASASSSKAEADTEKAKASNDEQMLQALNASIERVLTMLKEVSEKDFATITQSLEDNIRELLELLRSLSSH